jgi:hypothetical protein
VPAAEPGPDSSEADWAQDDYPGMLLRRNGKVSRVPLDRDLQAAMDWAAKEFFNPDAPVTPREPPPPPTASPSNSRFHHKS